MIDMKTQAQFNLEILREGLSCLAANKERKVKLNKSGLKHLDDIFDNIPLDYLPWLLTNKTVSKELLDQVADLYHTVENVTGNLTDKEIDKFILDDGEQIKLWRSKAEILLQALDQEIRVT